MSMEYIRKAYGVPAKRGGRVKYYPPGEVPRIGLILGSRAGYLRILLDPKKGNNPLPTYHHPAWYLEYLADEEWPTKQGKY